METFLQLLPAICLIGVICNFYVFGKFADQSPEGGMGMGAVIPVCFVPWLLVLLYLVAKLVQLIRGH
jgi:hypothetical protein